MRKLLKSQLILWFLTIKGGSSAGIEKCWKICEVFEFWSRDWWIGGAYKILNGGGSLREVRNKIADELINNKRPKYKRPIIEWIN